MSIRILYEVFRTRFEGCKLPSKEAVKHTRVIGDLVYTERVPGPQPGRGIWAAMLLRDDGESYIIPVLDRAQIRKIRGGILISGTEVIPRGRSMKNIPSDRYPQTWWCRPVALTNSGFAPEDMETPAEVRRKAKEHELDDTAEARRVAAALTRRPTRRVAYDPKTASGHYLGHF